MALVERGRSAAERTRHIDIRYFWVKERVDQGEVIIKHLGDQGHVRESIFKATARSAVYHGARGPDGAEEREKE